ncbi:unnamed protein product [Pleuronectes platessa]|uniref:Uncharacterized protein n=1 Tax=Pleuronectes platessa TaxID=8262 RepID=A0A9N7VJ40_PLEPL|nr:unnamed protein product [Pleuronectes platessa]
MINPLTSEGSPLDPIQDPLPDLYGRRQTQLIRFSLRLHRSPSSPPPGVLPGRTDERLGIKRWKHLSCF